MTFRLLGSGSHEPRQRRLVPLVPKTREQRVNQEELPLRQKKHLRLVWVNPVEPDDDGPSWRRYRRSPEHPPAA